MKKDIHPKVNTDCVVTCACGNSFTTLSTLPSISVDICSKCHPFFTGQQKFVDTEGRIDKFEKKRKLAEEAKKKAATKSSKKSKKASKKQVREPSLKEMLSKAREAEKETKK